MELSLLDFVKELDNAIGGLTYEEMKRTKVELNITLGNGDLACANLRDVIGVLEMDEGELRLALSGETSHLV